LVSGSYFAWQRRHKSYDGAVAADVEATISTLPDSVSSLERSG
jgi:hypothetical protein